ncbi:unnamed protein product [Closterium sp. NIES-64]|nr:unnamed protein product [Closterium sp. NIES-64]
MTRGFSVSVWEDKGKGRAAGSVTGSARGSVNALKPPPLTHPSHLPLSPPPLTHPSHLPLSPPPLTHPSHLPLSPPPLTSPSHPSLSPPTQLATGAVDFFWPPSPSAPPTVRRPGRAGRRHSLASNEIAAEEDEDKLERDDDDGDDEERVTAGPDPVSPCSESGSNPEDVGSERRKEEEEELAERVSSE